MSERCGAYAENWEELDKPKGWLGCSLPKGHEGDHRDPSEYTEEVKRESDEHRNRRLRINFWRYALQEYKILMNLSAVTIVEQTIKDLERLNETA